MNRLSKTLTAVLLTLLIHTRNVTGGEPCEPGWAFDGGARCVKATIEKTSWGSAACERMQLGAELYSVESAATQIRIGGLVEDGSEFWVGMRDEAPRSGWQWKLPTGPEDVKKDRWAASRPDIDLTKNCAYVGGGAGTMCKYPTVAYPTGAPVICEEDCSVMMPVLCFYKSAAGNACDPPDIATWKLFDQACYKLLNVLTSGGAAAEAVCKDPAQGGNGRAILSSLLDNVEGEMIQNLLTGVDRAWLSASRTAPVATQAWTWVDPLVTYVPSWYDSRDTTNQLGACAYIAGSGPSYTPLVTCGANTGDLCSENCENEFQSLCQVKAGNRPWAPEEYLPPMFPPTPTATLTKTETESHSVSLSPTLTESITQSESKSLTLSVTITPPPTPTEVPIDGDDNPIFWVILGLMLCCVILILALLFYRHKQKADAVPWTDVRAVELTTPFPLTGFTEDLGLDSDPSDVESASPLQREVPASLDNLPLEKHANLDLFQRAAPGLPSDSPWVSDWAPRVANLTTKYNISPAQALDALRECGGHAGLAGRYIEDRHVSYQMADRRDV
eukprot:TRINITY_DN9518_c0_g1_i1.p1 TRINITY_DN9518_c0_g1~~TRINITY_DN9518_c0_g1_i1.p1  ORF type:complete len:559 (+),score=81.25 TRINITY_DN9518_c0_g1_i1:61-1737(+)